MSCFETLPEITDRQFFICENGCGICTPIKAEITAHTERTPNGTGNLVVRTTQNVWVNNCCKEGIQVWDNNIGDVVIE